ncbi:MAG: LysE family translocator [Arcobacter sp.]|jgi:threonine/homoserine/homoserine lactone efflux protein|uniref:LysE family translocator n=1 Tax=Arcobacter sp. TaxID=1872629 RepID=UPI003D00321F
MITLRQTINYGKKYAYFSSMGIGLGILVHLSYTILGFGIIIKNMPYLLDVVRILGALYLIYLGIGSLRSESHSIKISKEKIKSYSLKKSFMIGFLSNLLNPKATLFFLSIFTSIVSIDTPFYMQSLYGFYCILANIFWYMLIANILSKKKNMNLYNKYNRGIEITIGLVLILLGLRLIILPL